VLERDGDICWRCGHPGAVEVGHKIPRAEWMAAGGHGDDVANLGVEHGVNGGRCFVCNPHRGRACNQEANRRRNAGRNVVTDAPVVVRSRVW
jgi:5-methylcytosine-specific restriction endonuclease McrA